MSELSIPERVAAGAAVLDQIRPGWETHVDLSILDVALPCNCVLGQVFGTFGGSPWETRWGPGSVYLGTDRGFEATGLGSAVWEYDELTAEWRRLIESRRSGAVTE